MACSQSWRCKLRTALRQIGSGGMGTDDGPQTRVVMRGCDRPARCSRAPYEHNHRCADHSMPGCRDVPYLDGGHAGLDRGYVPEECHWRRGGPHAGCRGGWRIALQQPSWPHGRTRGIWTGVSLHRTVASHRGADYLHTGAPQVRAASLLRLPRSSWILAGSAPPPLFASILPAIGIGVNQDGLREVLGTSKQSIPTLGDDSKKTDPLNPVGSSFLSAIIYNPILELELITIVVKNDLNCLFVCHCLKAFLPMRKPHSMGNHRLNLNPSLFQ